MKVPLGSYCMVLLPRLFLSLEANLLGRIFSIFVACHLSLFPFVVAAVFFITDRQCVNN